MGVSLRWHARPSGRGNDQLAGHVVDVRGPGEVRVGRNCPRCGSDDHGMPWARHSDRPVAVSLSKAGGYLLTAVRAHPGPLGVDIAQVAQVQRRLHADDVLHPDDTAFLRRWDEHERLARAWVAKEALLKADGTGLAVDPTHVRLGDHRVEWVSAPAGLIAAVSIGRR